jgi:glycerol uptake facilitator-like aquaporin
MGSNPYLIADIVGILIGMIIVLLYYQESIKSFFDDQKYLFVSCVLLFSLFGIIFLYFQGLGY